MCISGKKARVLRLTAARDGEPRSACPKGSPVLRRGSFPRLLPWQTFPEVCVCVCALCSLLEGLLRGGRPCRTGGGEADRIFTPKARATCEASSLLPSPSGSFWFSAPSRPRSAPGLARSPRPVWDPISPLIDPPCYSWWLLGVFSPPRGLLSLSLALSLARSPSLSLSLSLSFSRPPSLSLFCCWDVLSAPHISSEPPKTAHPSTSVKMGSDGPLRVEEKHNKKKGGRRNENVTERRQPIPLKCLHVSRRWRCQASARGAHGLWGGVHAPMQTHVIPLGSEVEATCALTFTEHGARAGCSSTFPARRPLPSWPLLVEGDRQE